MVLRIIRFLQLGLALIFSLGLSACQQFEVQMPLPQRSEVSRAPLSVSEKDGFDLEMFFPDGRQTGDPSELGITFMRVESVEPGQSKDFWYRVSTRVNSPIRIGRAVYEAYPKPVVKYNRQFYGVLKLFLARNLQILPSYPSSRGQNLTIEDLMLSTGRLVEEKKSMLGFARTSKFCNSVLVGENLALTNHHCISKEEDCDLAKFIFVNRTNGIVASCKSIIHSEPYFDQTLVELEEPVVAPFKPLPIADREYFFESGTPLFVASTFGYWQSSWLSSKWKISDDAAEKASASLISCSVTGSADFASTEDDELRIANYGLTCTVEHGQSGSPVIGSDGRLVGLVWGKNTDDSSANFIPLHPHIRAEVLKRLR